MSANDRQPELSDLFFTGRDNPRDGCIMIGYTGPAERPVYYHFETPDIPPAETRTTIYRGLDQEVAHFDWAVRYHLGTVTIGGQQMPMSYLVMRGSTNRARSFEVGGKRYEWRRATDQGQGAYDLHQMPASSGGTDVRLATFRRFPQLRSTPVGPTYAIMQFSFDDDNLMLYALMSLNLGRWMDWRDR